MKYFEKPKSIKIVSIIYFLIWLASLLTFWFYIKGDGEGIIIWGVLFMWLVMPCTTIISSAIVSYNLKVNKFISYFIIAMIYILLFFILGYLTFDLNIMLMNKSIMPIRESEALLNLKFGVCSSIIGIALGALIKFLKKKHK